MPAPLPIEWERVTWRIERDVLNTLRAVYGENVNEAVRVILANYTARLRELK